MPIERTLDELGARADASSVFIRAKVDAMAMQAFVRLWDTLMNDPELSARDAVRQVVESFGTAYTVQLAEAFSRLLQQPVAPTRVRSMPVGDVVLSDKLYRHGLETAAEVSAIVRTHAQGSQQARELLLSLYDGYAPGGGVRRPLEGTARASLPKALREVTRDVRARRELGTLYTKAQQQAARLKSPALRASYLEALDAWKDG
ncbi:MAG TPA: hypothetical protein VLJ62_30365, partial [Burkholderiaceae bacterium]|nr:hypothetical protein [Burkholderiaceae bacterium]